MRSNSFKIFALLLCLSCTYFFAQTTNRSRVPQRIDNSRRSSVPGNLHRLARSEFDRGPVDNSMPMERVTMVLKPTAEQEAALETLFESSRTPLRRATTNGYRPKNLPIASASRPRIFRELSIG